jgi:hypothetical protein
MPAYPAETELTFGNLTVVVAEKTMKNPFFIFFIKHGFFFHVPLPDFFRFAETFLEMYLISSCTQRGLSACVRSAFRAL